MCIRDSAQAVRAGRSVPAATTTAPAHPVTLAD